jgi:hypothetical protein
LSWSLAVTCSIKGIDLQIYLPADPKSAGEPKKGRSPVSGTPANHYSHEQNPNINYPLSLGQQDTRCKNWRRVV